MFKKFGELLSVFVAEGNAPKRLHAILCFKDPKSAAKAVEDMHEKEFDGQLLYVALKLTPKQLAQENSKKEYVT